MKIQKTINTAAETYISNKKADLMKTLDNVPDEPSRKFIAAQLALIPVERQIVVSLSQLLVLGTTRRHMGMALAQAVIGPLNVAAKVLADLGQEGDVNDLLASFYGRLDEITPVVLDWAIEQDEPKK